MERGSIALGMVERRFSICRAVRSAGDSGIYNETRSARRLAWWWSSPKRFSACSISASPHCCPADAFWSGADMVSVALGVGCVRFDRYGLGRIGSKEQEGLGITKDTQTNT